ncbi:coactosin-like protein [Sycon ciliatum]|uniref:coactosin-like protein n=1 Tax=Sycon ciliatum TaxID=27933 RepID=UPI0031F68CEC
MPNVDNEALSAAYQAVRDDSNDTTWAAFGYEGPDIVQLATGPDYEDFLSLCADSERVYGYIRITTGDEMSKRSKFVFITWIGDSVSPLKKARVSTDKAFVKQIITNFAKEVLASSHAEITIAELEEVVRKAGGANYGTGR